MTSHDNEPPQAASQRSEDPPFPAEACFYRRHRRLIASLTILLLVAWFGPKWFAVAAQWQARQQLVAREPEKALWWLDLASVIAGTNGEERFLRARAQRKLGRFDLAKPLMAQAFELGYPRDRLERENWLFMAQSGRIRQAEPHLVELLTVPLGDIAEICEAYFNGFRTNDRFDDALKVLDTWISESRQDSFPYYLRGRAFRSTSRTDKAIESFQRALELKPNYHAVALELGEIHAERQDFDEALRYLEIARNANSEVGLSAEVGRAQCYRKLGQFKRAWQILVDVLDVDPGNNKARMEQSHIDLENNRPEAALKKLIPLYKQQPHSIELRNTLAKAMQATGKAADAQQHFIYVAEAMTALYDHKPKQLKILGTRPDDLDAQYELGLIDLLYESEERGLQRLIGVLESNPNHRPTLEALLRFHDGKAPDDPRHRMLADRFRKKLDLPSEPPAKSNSQQSASESMP